MGSILAGTSYAERIEHVTTPVKDLFGSVFFISVGMMVQPDIIVHYWWPILLLSVVVIAGMIIFGTFGMLVTGQSLRVAMESGFSLTQIGEFAFIIATLGMSLGVLNAEIYPIVVAVSVITTFTTPYFIRMADPAYHWVERRLPERFRFLINRYSAEVKQQEGESRRRAWVSLMRRYIWRIALYSIIIVAISMAGHNYLMPHLAKLMPSWSRFVGTVLTLTCMAPFLLALCLPPQMERGNDKEHLSAKELKLPRIIMMVFRLLLALAFIVHELSQFYSLKVGIGIGIACLMIMLMLLSRNLNIRLRHIESRFLENLNERELRRSGKNNNLVNDLHLAHIRVGYGCPFVGERLVNSKIRQRYGISLVMIQRGAKLIPVPGGDTRIFPGDVIGVIGTDEQISAVLPIIDVNPPEPDSQAELTDFKLTGVTLTSTSPLAGQTLASADVRRNYQTHVVALERNNEFFDHPASIPLKAGDRLWIVGTQDMAERLK
ncbi:MAG: cation:proton antiporter, partial [Muribaculaceae bacterium]|nr:cation:proton antiporter [Muribaculaceae bacterium]